MTCEFSHDHNTAGDDRIKIRHRRGFDRPAGAFPDTGADSQAARILRPRRPYPQAATHPPKNPTLLSLTLLSLVTLSLKAD